jgi:hypothetical protein
MIVTSKTMKSDRIRLQHRIARPGAWVLAVLLAVGAPLAIAADASQADSTGEEPDAEAYPRTIEKIWYRTGKDLGFAGPKHSGDLMITRTSLEFLSKKADISIPFESVGMISFGKMRGDVNTDWVVLTIEDGGSRQLIGFRDGRKLGYGVRTPDIFESVLDVAEELSWGQFAAPEGLVPYTELDHVFAMAVPEGWPSYHHEMISSGGSVFWGTAVFTPESMTSDVAENHLDGTERELALEAIQRGETSAWIVRRVESKVGMTCEGFTDKGLVKLANWIAKDPFLNVPFDAPQATAFEPAAIGVCRGVRATLRASADSGPDSVLELRAVSQGEVTLILALRTNAEDLETDMKLFEAALPTVKFAITR